MRKFFIAAAACALLTTGAAMAKGNFPALSKYEGKYLFDKVNGFTIFENTYLRTAVKNAVSNKMYLQWLFSEDVTTSDIKYSKSYTAVLISACEPHNCGWHHWTTIYSSTSRRATVCYHNEDFGSNSAWYADGTLYHRQSGNCPAEFSEVPAIALRKIAK